MQDRIVEKAQNLLVNPYAKQLQWFWICAATGGSQHDVSPALFRARVAEP